MIPVCMVIRTLPFSTIVEATVIIMCIFPKPVFLYFEFV